jgi:putative membrane protein
MSDPRKPAAFRLDNKPEITAAVEVEKQVKTQRKPAALPSVELLDQPDVFEAELNTLTPAIPEEKPSGFSLGKLFFGALGLLVSLGIGLWVDSLIRNLFSRSDWLGYTALGLAIIAGISFLFILGKEVAGLARLNAASRLRKLAEQAFADNDAKASRKIIGELETLFANVPQTAAGRKTLEQTRGEVVDGRDLIKIAEVQLLSPLDQTARTMILESAKRVSIVTAVSPRALVDVGYILFESARLIRRLAELYGGRPGTLGLFRLSRTVLSHLAVTGTIAVGDSLIQQLVGHGIAAKLSARLGEGVINGLMTARVGIAAMDVVRPLPFNEIKRPGIGDFISELVKLNGPK